jgi:hypothetical protein
LRSIKALVRFQLCPVQAVSLVWIAEDLFIPFSRDA